MDAYAPNINAMGLALANAAKFKLVGLLARRLAGEGIYVGEVMVAGTIKGAAWADANSIAPSTVGNASWKLYRDRGANRARLP